MTTTITEIEVFALERLDEFPEQAGVVLAVLRLHSSAEPHWEHYRGLQCDHCRDLCHSETGLGCESPDAAYPCPTVRTIAAAWSHHPDYRQEWAP